MSVRTLLSAVTLAWALSVGVAHTQGVAEPWYRRSPKPKDFAAVKLPWNAFAIELPKAWQLVPLHGGALLGATEKTGANRTGGAIVVEHMKLLDTLSPSDLDPTMAQYQGTKAQERDPSAQGLLSSVKEVDGQRFIFIEYTRAGVTGSDKVVVYEFPAGRVLYRLIGIAPEAQVARYQPVFAHVAASFKLTDAAPR